MVETMKTQNRPLSYVNDIRANGIQDTVKYVNFNNSKYIVDGHHRVVAAKYLGMQSVPAIEVTLPYAGYKTIEDLFW